MKSEAGTVIDWDDGPEALRGEIMMGMNDPSVVRRSGEVADAAKRAVAARKAEWAKEEAEDARQRGEREKARRAGVEARKAEWDKRKAEEDRRAREARVARQKSRELARMERLRAQETKALKAVKKRMFAPLKGYDPEHPYSLMAEVAKEEEAPNLRFLAYLAEEDDQKNVFVQEGEYEKLERSDTVSLRNLFAVLKIREGRSNGAEVVDMGGGKVEVKERIGFRFVDFKVYGLRGSTKEFGGYVVVLGPYQFWVDKLDEDGLVFHEDLVSIADFVSDPGRGLQIADVDLAIAMREQFRLNSVGDITQAVAADVVSAVPEKEGLPVMTLIEGGLSPNPTVGGGFEEAGMGL